MRTKMSVEERRKKVISALKQLEKINGISFHRVVDLLDGNLSLSAQKNILRIPLAFPADQMIDKLDVREVLEQNWKVWPFIIIIDPESVE
jgi:hypothetical protein